MNTTVVIHATIVALLSLIDHLSISQIFLELVFSRKLVLRSLEIFFYVNLLNIYKTRFIT